MITQIEIENFKSLKHVKLDMGQLNLFVGANASGKSNFLDALRVLQGIGYGFTIGEIFNGRPKRANSVEWKSIRGGSTFACFRPRGSQNILDSPIKLKVKSLVDELTVEYCISFSVFWNHVIHERLLIAGDLIFEACLHAAPEKVEYLSVNHPGNSGSPEEFQLPADVPVLTQISYRGFCSEKQRVILESFENNLSNIQQFDPDLAILKGYSAPNPVRRMGERGENFAALVDEILKDQKDKEAYLSWLHELDPIDISEINVIRGAINEAMFAVKDKSMTHPAPILSDGTLRFAAITAAFFQPDMPDILTFEEIENGIHPTRLGVLVELLKNLSQDRQVMATTHSPTVLEWLREPDYKTTFLCKRDEETGESLILPLTEVPRFVEIAKKHPVTDLMVEGWLEDAS